MVWRFTKFDLLMDTDDSIPFAEFKAARQRRRRLTT